MTAPPSPAPAPRRARRLALALGLLAAPLALLGWAAFVEPRRLEVTRHALGEGAGRLRVVHLTDLHVDSLGSLAERVPREVAALEPDLIVITGDTLTSPLDPGEQAAARALLGALSAPLGVWGCLGNHEAWVGPEALGAWAGVRLLRGASQALPGLALTLHGVEDPRGPLPTPGPGLDLLLCHYPAIFPRAAQAGFELVLAGHSHGGQVRVPLLGAPILPFDCDGFDQGWFQRGESRMYVSRGVGTSILPLRFACRPELALIELRLP